MADMSTPLQFASLYHGQEVFTWSDCLLDPHLDLLFGNMVFVCVPCSGTSFPWHLFFLAALLWGSTIHKHTRWMWQGNAPVIFQNWEKCSCRSNLVSTLSVLLLFVLSWRVSQAWNPHWYKWAQVLEACDCLKLLSIYFNFCIKAPGVVCRQLGLLSTDLHVVGCGGFVKTLN